MATDPFAYWNQSGVASMVSQGGTPLYEIRSQSAAPKQSFASNVGHSLGSFGGAIANAVTDGFQHGAHLIQGIGTNMGLDQRQAHLESSRKALESKDMAIDQQNKAGQMTPEQFKSAQAGLLKEYQNLSSTAKGIQTDHYGAKDVLKDYLPVAGTVAAIAAPFTAPIVGGAEGGAAAVAAGTKAAEGFGSRAAQVAMQSSRGVGKGIDAALGAGTAPTSSLAAGTAKIVGRNTAFVQPTIQTAENTVSDAAHGNVAGALGNAALLAAPGAISGLGKLGAKLAPEISSGLYGREGLLGAIAKAGGPDMIAHLDSLQGADRAALEKTLRRWQDYKLAETGGDINQAVHELFNHFETAHRDFANMAPKEWAIDLKEFVNANTKVNKLGSAGKLEIDGKPVELREGQSFGAYRYNTTDHTNLMGALKAAPDYAGRVQVIKDQIKAGADWTKNPNVRSIIEHAVTNGGEDYAKEINSIVRNPGLFAAKTGNTHLGGGYFAGIMENKRAEFKALKDTAEIDRGKAAGAVLGKVGNKLTSMGLSTQATDAGAVSRNLKASFNKELEKLGIDSDKYKKIYNALAGVNKPGVNDGRFLTNREAAGALAKIAPEVNAKDVLQALRKAHADLPKSLIGAGPAKLNQAILKTPALGKFIRVEQAGRYDSGPLSWAFRIKQAVKGAAVAGAEGLQLGVKATKDDISALREEGLTFKGASGNDQGISSSMQRAGGSTELMHREQEALVGNLAASLAKAQGKTVREMIADKTEIGREFRNSLDLVHDYGHGGYLNSPMAKTLNLIIFPSRFETKVAIEATKALRKLPAAGQIGVASGLAHLKGYLDSPEGEKWQRDNSDAIGLIKAFTPLQTIDNVNSFFTKGFHVGDLGELGGLPIGVIGTMLTHQGVSLGKLGPSPYLDPKTGQPHPGNIPTTLKARGQQALTDLLGSMFSYPGRTAGLTSKTQIIQDYVPGLKPGKGETTYTKPKKDSASYSIPTTKIVSGTVPKLTAAQNRTVAPTIKSSSQSIKAPKRKIYGVRPR